MTRTGTLSLAAIFAGSLLLTGATFARADDDHGKFHRKIDRQHVKYHRKGTPPYGNAYGYHRHGPDCRHDTTDRYRYGRTDAQCGHIIARAEKARDGLRRWEGTGRHRDAVVAWRRILQQTPQRLSECRREAYARSNRGFDRYDDDTRYDDYRYGDPYASGDGFEWKRDWPFLLGGILGQYSNR